MTNPTPEPGQHVWIEAEVVERVEGVNVFVLADPAFPDGYVPGTPQFLTVVDPERVVWYPADVPPPAAEDAARSQILAAYEHAKLSFATYPNQGNASSLVAWTQACKIVGVDRETTHGDH